MDSPDNQDYTEAMKAFNPLEVLDKKHIKKLAKIYTGSDTINKDMLIYLHNNGLNTTLESMNLVPSYYCYALEHVFNITLKR
jgi:hypothetical protein